MFANILAIPDHWEAPDHGDDDHHWDYHAESPGSDWTGTCADGVSQSPIDIAASDFEAGEDTRRLVTNYNPVGELSVKHTGHGIQVDGNFGYAFFQQKDIDGEDVIYNAVQFHFHFPSEHTIDGVNAAGELHIVHARCDFTDTCMNGEDFGDDAYSLLVVGVLIAEGDESEFLNSLNWGDLPEDADADHIPITGTVDTRGFLGGEYNGSVLTNFARYEGSLTTPPCTEAVHWFVLDPATTTLTASADQITAFENVQSANNRATQPLGDRHVYANILAVPDFHEECEVQNNNCDCNWVGIGTETRVLALCQEGDVCYNLIDGWCAKSERLCEIPGRE